MHPSLSPSLLEELRFRLGTSPSQRSPEERGAEIPDGGDVGGRTGDGPIGHAAVAALLRERRDAGGLEVLLVRRAERAGDPWSGQIALPGGRHEEGDRDLVETAMRETREEVRLQLDRKGLLGEMDPEHPFTLRHRLLVTPYVFAAPADARPVPNPGEIAGVRWVALSLLRDPARREPYRFPPLSDGVDFPAVRIGEEEEGPPLWGLTLRILERLLPHLPE